MHALSLLLAVLAAISAANVIPETRIMSGETERIIFGNDAVEGQFPYACALFKKIEGRGTFFICTCSILSSVTVMTAAHCVVTDDQLEPANLFYAIANYDKSKPEVRIEFREVIAHSDYDSNTLENDIALFRVSTPIPFTANNNVDKICIAREDTAVDEYVNATAMGWGDTAPSPLITNIPDILQYAEQKILSNSVCSIFYLNTVGPNKICGNAGSFLRFYQGICQGDSGGPLVHLSGDKDPVQIGIASFGNALADCGLGVPTVWTRVSAYNQWIRETSKDGSICSI